ncbi:L-arabinose isomerase [Spirochaeta cellobiosiphila]|uniref:L-arabinose isomerase n=1 Tax=Spirochaeta cellobiosiphila TaxID=504483 RepID=UPI00040B9CB9|nr:L-arabinose isomerase [Spirochaeta cellobiosiphila]
MRISNKKIWFITGSQDLYGEDTLKEVARHSKQMVGELNESANLPVELLWRPTVLTSEGIAKALTEASADEDCIGVVTWMHTFSPAKMWIKGLSLLAKPLAHLHTQFNRDIPWDSIDMDFMNLNQSAHGDREYGYIGARMRIKRKIIAGYWKDKSIQGELGQWMRAVVGWDDLQNLRVARFGDNMRNVAVTEGDKVEVQIKMGIRVDGYGIMDLVDVVNQISDKSVDEQYKQYQQKFQISDDIINNSLSVKRIKEQAKIELGLRKFLEDGGFGAFTTTFEDLHGLPQLPGLAVQNLLSDGYGFGAEGDWKHASMVRALKTMAKGLGGGTSFMEDYTYHMDPNDKMVLGAHMLEICPSIGNPNIKPKLEVHPLGIGDKDDPARLVFDGDGGNAINVSLVDMGNRLRLIVNEVDAIKPTIPMPKLPVARVLWKPKPDFKTGLESWIKAGGAHHTVFSTALNYNHIADLANILDMELIRIGEGTTSKELDTDLILSELAAKLR